jgi:hypothetical protein
MPPPQIFSLDGHAFGLTVSGVQVVQHVPTDVAPIRWDWPSATTPGGITFTQKDTASVLPAAGSVIRLTDNVNNDLLFSGVLTNVRTQRSAGPYRHAQVTGTGWGFYLDNQAVSEDVNDYSPGQQTLLVVLADILAPSAILPQFDFVETALLGAGIQLSEGAIEKTTIRSALGIMMTKVGESQTAAFYVDNDKLLHLYTAASVEATAVGTATSVGDEAALLPEYLVYENGGETYKGLAYVYDSAGTAQGIAPNTASEWEASEPSRIWDAQYGYTDYIAAGTESLNNYETGVVSVTFSTTEDSSFRPHQEITVDDSLLTDSTAETLYVSGVSGTIDHRNVLEVEVSAGAQPRSFVQDVIAE